MRQRRHCKRFFDHKYIIKLFLLKTASLQQATGIENSSVADPDLDPDPHGYAFILVGWIRIRIGNTDPDPNPGGP